MKLCACRKTCHALVVVLAGVILNSTTRAAEPPSPAAILQDLKTFNVMGTVLHTAAHPDDENTQLITYLAKGRMYRTAYLSVTRGDGGQNLIGSDIFELLGVARTQELLEARKLDGGRQFFTRAIDFGYSKSWQETLNVWDRQQAVGDVVRVIRTFRPDVIITRFSPQSGGHGQHTGSGVLSLEAFKVSGDSKAYPEQIAEGLRPWQPRRIMLNAGGFGRGGGGGNAGNAIQMGVGGTDPVSGETFGELASRSRAMHKTQGFDRAGTGGRGGGGRGGANPMQSFIVTGGEPATNDIMDGVDTTWARVPGGAEVGRLTEAAIAKFNSSDLAANVPALLDIKKLAASLPADQIVNEKREALDRIIQDCLGLSVKASVWPIEVVPGETMNLHHTATIRANLPVRWVSIGYAATNGSLDPAASLSSSAPTTLENTQTLPADTKLTQAYWLRHDPTPGMFVVDEPPLIGQPENPPIFPITYVFEIAGQRLVLHGQPLADPPAGASERDAGRRLDVIAPLAMKFASDVRLFSSGSTRQVELDVVAHRPAISGRLRLDAPAGWKVEPAALPFKLDAVGQQARFTFSVTAPAEPGSAQLTAEALIGDRVWNSRRIEVDYRHLALQLLQPPARTKAVTIDLAIKGKSLAYLPGAGDEVAPCLEQMGYAVTQLTGADLTVERLKMFDALVVGVRAFETRQDLTPALPAIMSYVEGGGNVIFQYNRGGVPNQFGPLSLQVANQRITDEKAAVTFLAPDHPALNTPNKITQADFDGWVQERGIYYPVQWQGFTPILASADPGEQPLNGGLLVGQHGNGYVVYTGLVFFRQLPEGVPGAYRLFANLVSLGK